MKLSIITVTYNSSKTISDTINSVNSQTYKNIEHIFVDGKSKDNTLKILKKNPKKNIKIIVKKSGIYEAMNIGIKKATGDIIQILNSDDIFQSNTVIEETMKKIKNNPKKDIFFGDVIFFKDNNFHKIRRYFKADEKKIKNLYFGEMPPHPASFVRKNIYEKYGCYNQNMKIASDFDFFFRIIKLYNIKYLILRKNIVRMRLGGTSNKYLKSYLITSKEICQSLSNYNQKYNKIKIYLRVFSKISELILNNESKLNKDFKLFNIKFRKKYYDKFTFYILKNVNFLNTRKNFILSGMNLAFLGYFAKGDLYPRKNLLHWPDGIFIKKLIDIKKIPGRLILKNIRLDKKINKINIIGNLSKISSKYLKKKFKLEINHIKLPYAPIDILIKNKISLKKNELTLVTLPTPKQEILAYNLAKLNKNYKIICIGASVAITSGEEVKVPKFMENYEFIWRLKNDTFRRFKRLIQTFYYFFMGKYIGKIYNKIIFKIIE